MFHLWKIDRIRSIQQDNAENYEEARSQDIVDDEVLGNGNKGHDPGSSFLAKVAIVLGIAATATVISICLKRPVLGSSLGIQFLAEGSSSSVMAAAPVGFTFKAFGYKVLLPEFAPGWIYFWLLMAAGCGLFISEEALNIWVGITLARMLSLDGTWQSFAESFSRNAPYIISTVLWVYWGVCISDLIPFYLGKLFRQSGASDDVCSRLGIGKEKTLNITRMVQKHGNLTGFVERFSLGVRNPTAFLAGAMCSNIVFNVLLLPHCQVALSQNAMSDPEWIWIGRHPCRGTFRQFYKVVSCVYPGPGMIWYISRVLLCWSLLWWLDHSSPSGQFSSVGQLIDVPEFSGGLDPNDFTDWLNHVERVFEYHEIPDHKKVKIVGIKLKGRASAWWEQIQTQQVKFGKKKIQDWSKMKKKLQEQFLPFNYLQTQFARRILQYQSLGRSFGSTNKPEQQPWQSSNRIYHLKIS
uniref:Uncharacterized protein n=2 Tax=Magnoliopsida TaxID=3398 RepID=A0A2N9J449_FAGSY